jgi:hypothetical protein
MAYPEVKLKSNGEKASPSFKPFLKGNVWDEMFSYPDSTLGFL